jgi:hypothetical protein
VLTNFYNSPKGTYKVVKRLDDCYSDIYRMDGDNPIWILFWESGDDIKDMVESGVFDKTVMRHASQTYERLLRLISNINFHRYSGSRYKSTIALDSLIKAYKRTKETFDATYAPFVGPLPEDALLHNSTG